jgi:hypothetical protein
MLQAGRRALMPNLVCCRVQTLVSGRSVVLRVVHLTAERDRRSTCRYAKTGAVDPDLADALGRA